VWYGGLIGGMVAGWLYVRATRLEWLRVLDHCIPFVALGHAIGRLGCFLNGCCYGKPTGAWWGVAFPGQPLPVIPTQLLEAAGLCFLYLGLRRAARHPAIVSVPGRLLGGYLVSYAVLRFAVEFLRGDQLIVWAGLTLQQLGSMALLLVGLRLVCRSAGSGAATPATRNPGA
jgi:phosphatidylglycerol:prolipoprotein diacylglycerol transferase